MVSVHRKLVLDAICIIEGIRLAIKQCIICGKEFDTKERNSNAKTCSKECSIIRKKQYDKQHYQDNRKNKLQYQRQYYQDNREDRLQYQRQYDALHPDMRGRDRREKETPGLTEAKYMAFENANFQCELTGQQQYLKVHHLNGYAKFSNQRADLNNLIVLNDDVHKHFHSIYGYKGDNTIDQFSEFVYQKFPLQFDQFRMSKYKYLPEHTYNT